MGDMGMAMDMVVMDMDTMDTMVREKQRLLLLLSQVMDTMDMVMVLVMDMDMVMDTMDTMARDLLSQVMDTMVMDMDMVMVMDMDIMDKYQSFFVCSLEFSLNEIVPLTNNWYK